MKNRNFIWTVAAVVAAVAMTAFMQGCGGGRSASMTTSTAGIPISAPPWYGPSLEDRVRTTAMYDGVTYYLPVIGDWYLYQGTAGQNWISAVGTTPGLSASMSNPASKIGLRVIPNNYTNPGSVEFYLDGSSAGTLDFSSESPFEDYSDDKVSLYTIAEGLDASTLHTVTMVISTGTVRFDGWWIEHENKIYHIDCSDANSLEYDTLVEAQRLRDGLEAYAEEYGTYPVPASFTNLITFINQRKVFMNPEPENNFSGGEMLQSDEYSAGDYDYEFASATEYSLAVYGGKDVLIKYTPTEAINEVLSITLDQPAYDHFATTSSIITLSGKTESNLSPMEIYMDPYLAISGGADGYTEFPATGTFSVPLVLSEGVNNISVKLKISSSMYVSLTRTITKDTTAPNILLIDPFPLIGEVGSQYAQVYETPVTIKAYVEIGSRAWLNNVPMTVASTGVFQSELEVATGTTTFTIKAADSFSNTNSVSYDIVYNP